MKVEEITINESENNKASFDNLINNTNNDHNVDNNPIKTMRTHLMQNFKDVIIKYIKEEKQHLLEDLKNIEYLCSIEKHEREISDVILLTEYLLKTDLFRNFKQMKIEEQTFLNIFTTICLESDLILFEQIQSSVYKTGDQASFYYLILQGKVSVLKPIEEKKSMTQSEYLDHLQALHSQKEKVLFEKTIQANNHILYVNKFEEEEAEIRDLIFREGMQEAKHSFSVFIITKTGEIDVFGDFGGKVLEVKNKKRGETILTLEKNTILLAVDEVIYREKVSRELNNFRMREAKFLNENFFLQNISRFNFVKKIFDFFKVEEFKRGEVIISDKDLNLENKINNSIENNLISTSNNADQERNYFYFLREGVLDVTINLSLIELINLIKNLVYKREYFIKDFFYDIDLDMKNQPEKFLSEFKKKRCMNLFRLSTYDCIGIEQIYYRKSDLYQVTVASENAKLYRLSLDDLKQIFKINKNSFNRFNNYVKKKMQNLLKRLIACKDMIIHKIDSTDNYPKENKSSSEVNPNSTGNCSNNYLNKIQNTFFKINQGFAFNHDLEAGGISNSNQSGGFINDRNIARAQSSVLAKPPLLENKMLNENIRKSNLQNFNINANANANKNSSDDKKFIGLKKKKNENKEKSNKAKNKDQVKKYKIIENGEDLNILYKNHKSPREFSKVNDKLFTMVNTSGKYKIPNIEKIIQEEVEKMNKPLSALKREQLSLKRLLKSEGTDFNNKERSLNLPTNNKHSNHNLNRKFSTSTNLHKNKSRTDFNSSNCFNKIISQNHLNKKMTLNSALNDEYRIDLEKEFFDSPNSIKVRQINSSSENYNDSVCHYNEIYGNPVLSPTFSKNSNKNFKNIENMLKNEHLNIVVSKIKNLNHINRNKKFDCGFKYDYNNFINTHSFSNCYIGDPKNVLESPMNIYNVSNENVVRSINYINFASPNNAKRYKLRSAFDNYKSSPNLIRNLRAKKENFNLGSQFSCEIITKNEEIVDNQPANEEFETNKQLSGKKENIDNNQINHEIEIRTENIQTDKLIKSNNNDDLNFEINNITLKSNPEPIEVTNKINETANKNPTTEEVLKPNNENKIKEDHEEIKLNAKIINEDKLENFLNLNLANNIEKNGNFVQANKDEENINNRRNDSLNDFKKSKLIRPLSVMNTSKRFNYNSINNTTNQSNLENVTEMNFNSNHNQFLLSKNNVTEGKITSPFQTIKNENKNTDVNQNFNLAALNVVNKKINNKVDKEISANLDTPSNKLKIIKFSQITNENKIYNNKDSNSLLNYKNLKGNPENKTTRNQRNGVNFSNSILSNRITTINNNNNNQNFLNANNKVNNSSNNNQVKLINISSPIYNSKLNYNEDRDSANFRRQNSLMKDAPDFKKMDEFNFKRLGLKSVKVRIPFNQNNAEKKFHEKYRVINLSNASKNGIKVNSINSNYDNNNDVDTKNLRKAFNVQRVSAKI